jgi:hypothetical protein
VKTYIEEFLTTFSGFHQTVFSFLTAYSLQQLFSQLTAHSNFFHSHSPTKQTLRMGIFVWAMRSQGLEPSAKCFCSMHELVYETKAMGNEQYHNNFGCYGFAARLNASYPVPT